QGLRPHRWRQGEAHRAQSACTGGTVDLPRPPGRSAVRRHRPPAVAAGRRRRRALDPGQLRLGPPAVLRPLPPALDRRLPRGHPRSSRVGRGFCQQESTPWGGFLLTKRSGQGTTSRGDARRSLPLRDAAGGGGGGAGGRARAGACGGGSSAPKAGSYVGKVAGTDAYIALVTKGDKVAG